MSSKRTLCPWNAPENLNRSQLKLYNSLTRNKEVFVPQNGNQVLWYSCGPTVYDSSHMGHARSYISFDIMRRILKDYFKYDVLYCMNITDIDDKIIKRARQTRLFDDYKQKNHPVDEVISTLSEAMKKTQAKLDAETDEAKKLMFTKTINRANVASENLSKMKNNPQDLSAEKIAEVLETVRDTVSELLDSLHGAEITDNSIFFDLPRKFEDEYFSDMELLNILPPDVLTRVTEYVPEIVEFVQKIIANGFAYEANGSVYFATSKFNQDEKHFYAKLVPEAFGDSSALAEGEGDLSNTGGEKKSPTDFALWKVSKPGEPSWDSPWGKGRPGWHIECSVMASAILGDSIDIHTGGYDLKFPHHDNELAQAEAYFGHSHWIRYFLHSGHLTIDGMKMSKSLKNFTSIKQALETYTAVQIRFAFLLHSWKDTLDYSNETMEISLLYERTFKEFFLNMKSILRNLTSKGSGMFRKWAAEEVKLNQSLTDCKRAVHTALCDSIDTRAALESMRTLITQTNIYTKNKQTSQQLCDYMILSNISAYITDMLRIFGAIDKDTTIGFTQKSDSNVNIEETVIPYLDCIADFRKSVKKNAAECKDMAALKLCDQLRDDVLPFLGVRMEDIDGDNTAIKLVDKDTLIKEREDKIKAKEAELRAKEEKKAKAEAEKKAKEAQKRIPPSELFTSLKDEYSKFDEKGMPTHNAKGEEMTKSQLKKLQKQYDAQAKKYQQYLKEQGNA